MARVQHPVKDPFEEIARLEGMIKVLQRATPLDYSSTTDAAGVVRTEFGHLPARGISPGGQFGLRCWDASGNLLFDPNTLANMGVVVGVDSKGPGQNMVNTAYAPASIPNVITFALAYPTRLEVSAFVTAKQTVAGKVGYARIHVSGPLSGTTGDMKFGGGTGVMDVTGQYADLVCAPGSTVGTLPAGSYTAFVEVKTDAGGTLYYDQSYLFARIISPAAY